MSNIFRTTIVLLVLLASIARCSSAFADCKGKLGEDFRPTPHASVDGWWLRSGFYDCLLAEIEGSRQVIDSYQDYQMISESRVRAYRDHAKASRDSAQKLREALLEARSEAESIDAWHTSPVLWFVVGVATTTGALLIVGAAK